MKIFTFMFHEYSISFIFIYIIFLFECCVVYSAVLTSKNIINLICLSSANMHFPAYFPLIQILINCITFHSLADHFDSGRVFFLILFISLGLLVFHQIKNI